MTLRLSAALLCLCACAQRVPDLDRTQPNKLQKSVFDGEWYYRQTVIDIPFGASFSFIGDTSTTERVRWEVTEKYLTAYRTFEFVRDSEKPYLVPGTRYVGKPIAQYAITGHFDVQRQYNPATGEQSNVLEENTNDRPWNERKYMRVDWSQNLLLNFEFVLTSMGANVSAAGSPYYVNDPEDPNHWFMGVKDAETGEWRDIREDRALASLKSADYFDMVTKAVISPSTFQWGGRSYPACYYLDIGADCAPSEITLRHSFLKVPTSDYEPLEYPDNYLLRNDQGQLVGDAFGQAVRIPMFDKFGFFRVERDAYDEYRGRTESNRIYLINRWNIWQRSTFADGKKMPYSQREVKPIVYYLSPDFPSELKQAAQSLITDWNAPLAETVSALTNGRLQNQQVVELRDNTFKLGDDGKILSHGQSIGDLRYSFIAMVNKPQSAAPLGYGPSSVDPLTGEILSASAFIYGNTLNNYAQYGKDVVDLLNGDISELALASGQVSSQAIAASIQNRGYTAQVSSPSTLQNLVTPRMREHIASIKSQGKEKLLKDANAAQGRLHTIDTRPDLVGKTLNSEVLAMLRKDNTNASPPSAEELKQFTPGAWLSRQALDLEKRKLDMLSRNCVFAAEFADDAIVGLARELKDKQTQNPAFDVRANIKEAVFIAVTAHEVGHTMGLRHNFEGSYDALNFDRRYWDLKGSNATALDTGMTDAQKAGKMREWQYSSIMDYGARFNSDIHGIGRYDKAAVRFGYGQLIDVFKNPLSYNSANRRMLFLGGMTPDFFRHYVNHTQIPAVFGGVDNFDKRTVVPYQKLIDQQLKGTGSLNEVPYLFCSDEYAGGTPSCDRFDQGLDAHEIVANAADSYERYYFFNNFKRDRRYFSPDGYLGRTFDRYLRPIQGIYQQWVYRQFLDASTWETLGDMDQCFHDHRDTAETDCAYLRSAETWQFMRSAFQLAPDEDLNLVANRDWNLDPNGGGAFAAGALEGLNEIFAIMQKPEPGVYINLNDFTGADAYRKEKKLISVSSSPSALKLCANDEASINATGGIECAKLSLNLGEGRYPFTNYDGNSGYYYFTRISWVGSFYDKLLGVLTLTDPTTNFIGVDVQSDIRRFAIGYNLMFPDLVHRLFSSIVAERLDDYAPYGYKGALVARPPFAANSTNTADFSLPPVSCTDADPNACVPLDTANNFTVRLYTLLYGMAFFGSTFNPQFLDSSQICVRGNGECNISDAEPCDTANGGPYTASCVQMTSPTSNKVYRAIRPAALAQQGLNVGLLEKAEALSVAYAALPSGATKDERDYRKAVLENALEDIELVRGFYSMFGYIQ